MDPKSGEIVPIPEENTAVISRLARLWVWPAGFLTLGFAVVLSVHPILDGDLWWHLKSGEWILSQNRVPQTDPFSYTAGARPWIDLHWLFQVVVFGIYWLSGVDGLQAFRILLVLIMSAVMFLMAGGRRVGIAGLVLLALAFFLLSERFELRPHLVSGLFLLAYIAILRQYPGRKWIWILPGLQVVWFNMHALAILGLAVVWIYAVGQFVHKFLEEPLGLLRQKEMGRTELRNALVVSILCLAALLVNPYGWQGVLFPLKLYTRISGEIPLYLSTIGEFRPTLKVRQSDPFFYYSYVAYASAAVLILLSSWRRWRVWEFCVLVLFFFLSLKARRNVFEYVIATLPVLTARLADVTAGFERVAGARLGLRTADGLKFGAAGLLCFILGWQILGVVSNRFYAERLYYTRFGWGILEAVHASGAAEFVKKSDAVRIYNDINVGGQLIWKVSPTKKVFQDSRLELYDDAFFFVSMGMTASPEEWRMAQEKWRFDAVVLNHRSEMNAGLIELLRNDGTWRLAYLDSSGMVFLRSSKGSVSASPVDELAQGKRDLASFTSDSLQQGSSSWISSRLEALSRRGALLSGYEGANPQSDEYIGLGGALLKLNRADLAEKAYETATSFAARSFVGRFNLAVARQRQGKPSEALEIYASLLEEGFSRPELYANAAEILMGGGEWGRAEHALHVALTIDPSSLNANYLLARVLLRQGRWKEAEEQLRFVLELDPGHAGAHRAMAHVLLQLGREEEAHNRLSPANSSGL